MKNFYTILCIVLSLTSLSQQPCTGPSKPNPPGSNVSISKTGTGRSWSSNGDWSGTAPTCSPAANTGAQIVATSEMIFDCPSALGLNTSSLELIEVLAGGKLLYPSTISSGARQITINNNAWVEVFGELRGESTGASDFDPTIVINNGGTLYVGSGGLVRLGKPSGTAGSLIVNAGGRVLMENGARIEIYNGVSLAGELTINGAICRLGIGAGPAPVVQVQSGVVVSGSGSVSGGINGIGWSPGAFSYPLPVKFTLFTGQMINGAASLKWETAQETNNSHFEIQRSENGTNWITLGQVNGNRTTNSVSKYQFTDVMPGKGTNLYRLKQVDLDGKFEYSRIVSVKNTGKLLSFVISPNPASDKLQINASTSLNNSDIRIYSMNGLETNIPVSRNGYLAEADLGKLPAGLYIIKVRLNEEVHTDKFVKL